MLRKIRSRERGANLVEFAIIAPFLLLLVFGIIEFGWFLGLNNDIRHGAREGARYAAVDSGSNAQIRSYVCGVMEPLGGSGFQVLEIKLNQLDTNGSPGIGIGDTGTISVRGQVNTLTGFPLISSMMPSQLTSTIDFRLEQIPSAWSDDGATYTAISC